MKNKRLLTMLAILAIPTLSYAQNDDHAYAGLQWVFGDGYKPSLVIGYRNTTIESNGDVKGGDLSGSYHFGNGVDRILLKGIDGDKEKQAELGVGYSFKKKQPIFSAGVQGENINIEVSYILKNSLGGSISVNSIGEYDVPESVDNNGSGSGSGSGSGDNGDGAFGDA